jgi:DNA (cytosine-5)-methyltransferase 1
MKVGSLFCGCGGSDLGVIGNFKFLNKSYEKLPFEIEFAIDLDKHAVETYNSNFKVKAEIKDICQFKEEIPDIDVLIGGFPCQSFSTVNPTKNPFDDRAQLYKEMVRLIKYKKPKIFIAENVKGLMVLNKGAILKKIIKEFENCDYTVKYKLLNAADYGIPQKRQRLFIVGVRNDLNVNFEFPTETHLENPIKKNKSKWIPLKKAVMPHDSVGKEYYFSKKAVEGMKNAKNNMKRGLYQDLEKPCLTITSHLAKQSLNSRDPVLLVDAKKEIYRRFTPKEAASIQSFPEDFVFVGSNSKKYKQIGNAIPPVLMWHVSKSIANQLNI